MKKERKVGQKKQVLAEVFTICKNKGDFVFHNDLVKDVCKKVGFGNPFDVSKLDNTKVFPNIMLEEDYFLIHLGEGRHQFIKGIDKGFHTFEEIEEKNIRNWEYKKSLLNDFDTSESNILSLGFNQKIIHEFLYEDITASPKVYNARRTKASLDYFIGKQKIETQKLQMEIDLTMERNGVVTIFEGKNNFPKDFAVYQLFNPYVYYQRIKQENQLKIKEINCCYLLRKKKRKSKDSTIRIYKYSFSKENDLTSIKSLKAKQYNLISK